MIALWIWLLVCKIHTRFQTSRQILLKFHRFHGIRNFCSFYKNRSSRWGHPNLLFDNSSLTWRIFKIFAVFAIFVVFAKIAALLTSSSTAFHWLDGSNFSQILQFSEKSQFSSGPSQLPLLQVFTDSTNCPFFFCKFCNFRSCVQTWTYLGARHKNMTTFWDGMF